MHPTVYGVFEEIAAMADIRGPVLEVGAVPGDDCLLRMPGLGRASSRVGLNLDGGGDCGGYEIIQGDANAMTAFDDGQFSAVFCNATLEHDRYFWKTLAEIRRVTARGGLVAIGVPGYAGMGLPSLVPPDTPFGKMLLAFADGPHSDMIRASTTTLGVHNYPGDFYRFSEQAVREVFMEGLVDVSVRVVMNPPRIIAWGRVP